MSNELSIVNETGKSIEEIMGFAPIKTSNADFLPSISRLGMIHQPIMGEVEVNGKKIKTEVVPIGSFTLKMGDEIVYSTNVSIRVYLRRFQWQRWNSETGEMEKSVMSDSLNGDLKDSIGGFNLGRPSGYIEDFNSLSDSLKQVIRSVKRVSILYGTVSFDNPTDENGEPVAIAVEDIPFVMDVKNRDSLKSINSIISKIQKVNPKKKKIAVWNFIKLEGIEDSIPTGAKFGKIKASLGDPVEFTDENEMLVRDFYELISYSNGKILDLHAERMSIDDAADAKLVNEIVSNDFVEVDE